MLDDAFKLTVDKIYPIKREEKNSTSSNIKDEKVYPV